MDLYDASLNDGCHIFVFGSNLAGRHGSGAARTAMKSWGAMYAMGRGRSGQAYALPTKDGNLDPPPLEAIAFYVAEFLDYAAANPNFTFLLTKIGCGLAGYTAREIAPLFRNAPPNVQLPEGWNTY